MPVPAPTSIVSRAELQPPTPRPRVDIIMYTSCVQTSSMTTDGIYDTSIPWLAYKELFDRLRASSLVQGEATHSTFKRYYHEGTIMENQGNSDIAVFQDHVMSAHECADTQQYGKGKMAHMCIVYERCRMATTMFPSTMDMHNLAFVKRSILRVHTRVEIVFECTVDETTTDQRPTCRVFVRVTPPASVG